VVGVEDFDVIAVEDGDDRAGEVSNGSGGAAPFLESGKKVNRSHSNKHVL